MELLFVGHIKFSLIIVYLVQFISFKVGDIFKDGTNFSHRSHWLRGLRRRCATARLLRLWVRIPPGAWISVCCECCVLSDRGLCDGLIPRPEESYRLLCIVVCDLETSKMRRPWPTGGCWAKNKQPKKYISCNNVQWFSVILFNVLRLACSLTQLCQYKYIY